MIKSVHGPMCFGQAGMAWRVHYTAAGPGPAPVLLKTGGYGRSRNEVGLLQLIAIGIGYRPGRVMLVPAGWTSTYMAVAKWLVALVDISLSSGQLRIPRRSMVNPCRGALVEFW